MSTDRVLVELIIAAPIDQVWSALRNRQRISQWFGWDYPGADEEHGFIAGLPEEIVGETRIVRAQGVPDRYVVEPYDAQRTIVRVIRSAPATDASWTGIYDDVIEGWTTFTHQLRFLIERAPQTIRRTVYLNGRARAAGDAPPLDAAGLSALRTAAVGDRYALTAATGEKLSGEIYYRTIYQLGISVDEFGGGLLIATTRARTAKSPHGGGTLLLVTYGLSEPAYGELLKRWAAWWREAYDVIDIQPAT